MTGPGRARRASPALNRVPQGLHYRLVRAGVHNSRKELCRQAVAAL